MSTLSFAFMPAFGEDEREALLLAGSIRQFGGVFSDSPIRVFVPKQAPLSTAAVEALHEMGCQVSSFHLPEPALDFPYAQKVYAAAQAESQAAGQTLVWLDSDALLIEQPDELRLDTGRSLGCNPVHLKNISSPADEPLDAFWQAVFAGCDVQPERIFKVTTMMDEQEIWAHFNAGLLTVRPEVGLLRAWQENFTRLYRSVAFAPFYRKHALYRVFIHQAVLAGTILARLRQDEIQFFSKRYNLPLFLLPRFPVRVEKPVLCRYDDFSFIQAGNWRGHPYLKHLDWEVLERLSAELRI